jgi:hypothetical protein
MVAADGEAWLWNACGDECSAVQRHKPQGAATTASRARATAAAAAAAATSGGSTSGGAAVAAAAAGEVAAWAAGNLPLVQQLRQRIHSMLN